MAAIAEKPFPTSADNASADQNYPGPGATPVSSSVSTGSTTPGGADNSTTKGGDMLDRVVQGAHHTIDRLAETAAPHVQRLHEDVSSRAEHAKEVSDEWAESLRCTVRENPLAAVATALALGAIVARLTQR
jgi:ElaB/YqjD/DUF883 family membrane-anchored ribosome-binding protein